MKLRCLPFVAGLLVLSGCARHGTEPSLSLERPILLPPPDDLAESERGIDAIPERDAIRLEWEKYPDPEAELEVYRAEEAPGRFTRLARVSAQDTCYLDERVAIGRRYWYFLAGRKEEKRSLPSDTLSYKLLEKPFALSRTGGRAPVFRWQVKEAPVAFVVKLFDEGADRKVWFCWVFPDFGALAQEVRYNWDGTARMDSLISGRVYRWRVDVVAPEANAGAESQWQVFVCP